MSNASKTAGNTGPAMDTFAKVYTAKVYIQKYTKQQLIRGAKHRAANARDRINQAIELTLPDFVRNLDSQDQKFSFAAYFRQAFPLQNPVYLRRAYGAYIKARLETLFGQSNQAVNRFKSFCAAIRAAIKKQPIHAIIKDWLRLGVPVSCREDRHSLTNIGCIWNKTFKLWEIPVKNHV
jgi:hypothetical protein